MPRLDRCWDSLNLAALLLWPLSLLFGIAVRLRRLAYRRGWRPSWQVSAPVIVVGNITAGGAGKTPLVIWLVDVLRAAGYRPGIVSRGYGGRSPDWPRRVAVDSDPREVGDEPVLLARRCRCPVVVAPDRVAAAQRLLADYPCDVILCDDGLQHYRLARDIEIAVMDGTRGLGNGFLLPAGPLREPPERLASVDFMVSNGAARAGAFPMTLLGEQAVNLAAPTLTRPLASFRGGPVRAVAGIGNPARFFSLLRNFGIHALAHPFPDHHPFTAADLDFGDCLPILMTEKDAVKCQSLARDACWYVPVAARVDPELTTRLLARLAAVKRSSATPDS